MKTKSPYQIVARTLLCALLALAGLTAAPKVQAANGTWTNLPASSIWTNVLNWNGGSVPGTINNTGNNGIDSTSIALFTNAIVTYGGAANPVIPDDATVANGKARMLGQLNFDGPNCGAYVFSSPSPYAAQTTDIPETGVLSLCVGATTAATNGSYIGATVTTPQNFLIPVQIRLPSSTTGVYGFTNNATSPLATYFFNNLFLYPGATSRAITFVLAGSNTGTNTIATLAQSVNQSTASCGVRKEGSGKWILSGANTFRAASPMNINDGTLIVKDPGAFGLATTATVNSNALLQIDGVTLTTAAITLQLNGTVQMNGSAMINGITVGNPVNTSVTVATTSASDVLTIGDTVNKVTGGSATTVLHFTGPGTIVLDAANNYVGKFSLDTGTNQLSDAGALGSAANYNLPAGAVLDLTPFGATGYILTSKALSANGTGIVVGSTASTILADPAATIDFGSKALSLTFAPTSTSGDVTHPVLYAPQGTMAFNGNAVTVNIAGSPLNAGTYLLARAASGNMTSSGAFVTLATNLVAGMVGEIVVSGGDMNLLVYAYTPKPLVWTGGDISLPTTWDRAVTTNWLNGVTSSVFNIYDGVTFNSVGSTNPIVSLASTLVPGSVTVNTISNDYTFTTTSGGQIAGGAGLLKLGTNTLFLNTANTYSGGTVVSNGAIKIGVADAIPSTGLGDVTLNSPGIIDLNGFNDTIGALTGNGTVDVTSGGGSILTIGDNDNSGTFSGVLQNTSGTLGITKAGLGTQTLTHSNYYAGNTDIELGTLKVTDLNALGAGGSALVINGGTLDLATNVSVPNLAGTGGTIANSTAATTNTFIIQGSGATIFSFGGSIVNGAGKMALKVLGGVQRMTANNTYTNGTIVGSGATFQIHNSPAGVTGPLIASNTATLGLSGGGSSPAATPTSITTVDGATVTFTSPAEGDIWGGQFIGSATATNRFTGPQSAGGTTSFSNFVGLVQFALTSGNFRFFNGGGVSGGDNTTFEFITGNVHTRDAQSVSLGAVRGGSSTCGIGGNGTATAVSTWIIGAKNTNCSFEGYISGSNNLVKAGSGTLVLDGALTTVLATDSATYTNYQYASAINYLNSTTVSNGVLALSSPNNLDNSPTITLATTNAVLDAANMGYVSNFTDINGANSSLITNGMLTILATTANGTPQVLGGVGMVKGNGVTNYGTINPGLAGVGGTLSISNGLTVMAGATNYFDLSDDLTGVTKASDKILVQGNVTLTGSSVIGIGALNGNLKVGKYTLIKYSGNLVNESGIVPNGTAPIPNFTLGGVMVDTSRATFVVSNAPGEVDLVVVSLNNLNLTWTGDSVSNRWDVVNSYTFTNFVNPLQFYQMDNVTFDDTANPTNDSVFLSGSMAPGSITVNSITNVIFGGNGNIQGAATLTKKGSGTLILTNGANSYYGGTVLSNGVLNVGMDSGNNQNDLALGTGPVTVNTSAELRFGGNGGAVVNHFVTNTIVVNGGTVKAQDGVQHLTNSTVTISAGGGTLTTVFATKNLVLDSPLLGIGNVTVSAVQAGTNAAGGQVILNNPTNTITGSVIIATNGNLALVGSAGLSNSVMVDVQLGGVLDVTARTTATWQLLSGQTLKGNGVIRGNLNTASGSILSPGASIGILTSTNAGTTVTLGGTTIMEINRGATPNCDRLAGTTNIFGGTLTVNNLGAAPALNDSFQLFTGVTNKGAFTTINLPSLSTGFGWSNSLAINGRLTVIATVIIPTIPPAITNFSLVGLNVVISGTNGQTGGTYYLLSTTNVANARNLWKTVATNVLGGNNYTFIGTNAVTPNMGQQFYMLSSTNYNP